MISSHEYDILYYVDREWYEEIKDMDTYSFLYEKEKFISTAGNGCDYVTPEGKRAMAEYLNYTKEQKHIRESISLSKEANDLSKESNAISKEANKKSDKSNRIALGSLITAVISIVVAVIAIVVSVA